MSPQLTPWRQRSSTQLNTSKNPPPNDTLERTTSNTSSSSSTKSSVKSSAKSSAKSKSSALKLSETRSQNSVNIEDFCLGTPQKVNNSHSNNIELFISVQEKAVFLPNLHKTARQHPQHYTAQYEETNDAVQTRRLSESDSDFAEEQDQDQDQDQGDRGQGQHGTSSSNGSSNGTNTASGTASGNSGSSDGSGTDDIHSPPKISPIDQGLDIQTGGSMENYAESTSPCSTLRGSVLVKLSKPTKIKELSVSFQCVSKTQWNILPPTAILVDSSLPNNTQIEDIAHIGVHHWDFVPLEQFAPAQRGYDKLNGEQSSSLIGQDLYGADVAVFKDSKNGKQVHLRKFTRVYNNDKCRIRGSRSHQVPVFENFKHIPRKLKQNSVQCDGVVFPPGEYVYNFTLLVDAHTPSTVHVTNGSVDYSIQAKVVRSGTFTPNVSGKLDVDVVRAPQDPASWVDWIPGNDTISVSRVWEDVLVYAFHVERKHLTLDAPTKMKMRFMALDGVPVKIHKVCVYAIENVSYMYSLDSGIKYSDPTKRILVYENDAGEGNLLNDRECSFNANIILPSKHTLDSQPTKQRHGEGVYFEPDVRGPYIKVRHRFHAEIHVSYPSAKKTWVVNTDASGWTSNIIDLNTGFTVFSRLCVGSSINLPSYFDNFASNENIDVEDPPTFDDAMGHQILEKSEIKTELPLKQ